MHGLTFGVCQVFIKFVALLCSWKVFFHEMKKELYSLVSNNTETTDK